MKSTDDQVTASIVRIIAQYDERLYGRAVADDGREFTAVGPPQVRIGEKYTLHGRWRDHPKHGRQFHFDVAIQPRPADRDAICHYLEKLPGIGPKTAAKLYDTFGDAIFGELITDHSAVAEAINFKSSRLEPAAAAVRADERDRTLKIELHSLLDGIGFPKSIVHAVIEQWGGRAPELIRNDPFRLMRFARIGFDLCDRFYSSLGLNPFRLKRQAYAGLYAMSDCREGHTWFGVDFWHRAIAEKIGAGAKPERALELLIRAGVVVTRASDDGQTWIADRRHARNETRIAQLIRQLTDTEDHTHVMGI